MKYPIPHEALDDRLAWTGSSGTGKTYDAGTAIERVLKDKSRVCIVDPLGVWWGLRLHADGKLAGFKVAIFGGPHGDIAINATSGKLIGEAVAGTAESCIIDLSEFDTEADQRRFMLAFLVALYGGLKGDLLHLVLDEADMWAPQRILDKEGDATRLHHNVQKIVRRGRVKGFIPWLVTQRPAEISKSVLSMMDGLVLHQMLSPQDINAVMDWVHPRADKTTAEMIYKGLPAFERGQAAVYIPRRRVLAIAQFPKKATFDSSRSPDRGEKKNRPDIALKPLDIEKLKTRLAKVEAEAKANDPNALKAEVAKLRAELAKAQKAAPAAAAKPAPDREALRTAEQKGFDQARKKFGPAAQRALNKAIAEMAAMMQKRARELSGIVEGDFKSLRATLPGLDAELSFEAANPGPPVASPAAAAPKRAPAPPTSARQPSPAAGGDGSLPRPQQRILNSLATWRGLGEDRPSNAQVAWLASYSPTSTSYTNPRGALKSLGLLDYPAADRGGLTDAGAAQAQPMTLSTSLLAFVLDNLPGPERRILGAIAEHHPNAISNEIAAAAASYSATSTSYTNPRGALKTKDLITYPGKDQVRAADWLFAA